jgi:hypothetical protein
MRLALLLAVAVASCTNQRPPELSELGSVDAPGSEHGGGGGGGGGCAAQGGIFNRGCVYLIGSTNGTECRHGVVAVADPSVTDVGFPCRVSRARVRPSDGRLVYRAREGGVRVFEPEARDKDGYPSSPADNDPLIATPGCSQPDTFFFFSDDGALAYRCGSTLYLEGSDKAILVSPGNYAIAGGPKRSVLLLDSAGKLTVHTESGDVAVQGLESRDVYGALFGKEGFLVAAQRDGSVTIELYVIHLDGSVARAGEYARLGASYATLASDGTLYAIAGGIVTKLPLGKQAETIYDETNRRVTTGYGILAVP